MRYRATNVQAIAFKLDECRYFLARMADFEKSDREAFVFNLSAFLSAFRSAQCKLLGVVKKQRGTTEQQAVRKKLDTHPDIRFLTEGRNMEVHGDGVPKYALQMLHPEDLSNPRTPVRIDPNILGWRLDNRSENPIVLFHDAFDALKRIIYEAKLATV